MIFETHRSHDPGDKPHHCRARASWNNMQNGMKSSLKPTLRRAAAAMATIVALMLTASKAHSQFTLEAAANFPPVFSGSTAWGDYDNDGRLDLLLTGADVATGLPSLSLWHNTGAGFSNVTATVAPGL